jgi:CO dehydrogenase nickel-insertion accessory protein CooC1
MKVIIVYSGKGGVGKTTTTINLARLLVQQGKRVFLLDADVNTPSVHNILTTRDPFDGLTVESIGFDNQGMVYMQDVMIRQYINDAVRKVKVVNPDYVLVDTPPSITDVHVSLMNTLKVSGVLMVTQPTQLSMSDVSRTESFFSAKGLYIIGLVQNMVGGHLGNQLPDGFTKTLAVIPMSDEYLDKNLLTSSTEPYLGVTEVFETLDTVILDVRKRSAIHGGRELVSEDDIRKTWDYTKTSNRSLNAFNFQNIATWGYCRERLLEITNEIGGYCEMNRDNWLLEFTVEKVSRLLLAFEEDEEAFFMVTKAPCTTIKLLPGEIGKCTLKLDNKYHYGVPSVEYHTSMGMVVLFPNECIPMKMEDINQYVREGHIITPDSRYIPPRDQLEQIWNAFGSRTGMSSDWESIYDGWVGKKEIVLPIAAADRPTEDFYLIPEAAEEN